MSKNLIKKNIIIDPAPQILEVFTNKHFSQLAYDNRLIYQENNPFPHIVFKDFLPIDIANIIGNEYPQEIQDAQNYKFHNHKYVSRHFLEDVNVFSTNLKLFSNAISSRSFLLFLETLTGIKSLLPDPYFFGGGAMMTSKGGHLDIHVDFNWHQKLQLWRRCNVLFYLTHDWKEEYKGNLELWSKDGLKKIKEVTPIFNRVVIFNTTSNSYHGQPVPIKSPKDKFRNVFSAFYYSSERGEETDSEPHFTKYQKDDRINKVEFKNSPYSSKITSDYLKGVIK